MATSATDQNKRPKILPLETKQNKKKKKKKKNITD